MMKFLELEAAYLVIGVFILAVTAFVTTRPFMAKGAFKKGMISVVMFMGTAIGVHYFVTTSRMDEVKAEFNRGGNVICESRARRKVAQSVIISKDKEWVLDGDIFRSKKYSRPFHSARCLVYRGKIRKGSENLPQQ